MGASRPKSGGHKVTRLAVILAGLTPLLLAASPAEAVRTEYFGTSHAGSTGLDDQDVQRMSTAGVRTDRFLLQWRWVVRSPGTYDWAQPDGVVGALASRKIRPVPFAWGSPGWVSPSPSRPPVSSAFARTAWASFLKAAVARYGPGGSYWTTGYRQRYGASAKPLPITSWQIWNEPNLQKFFDPGGTAAHAIKQYAQLVKISHDAINSRDRRARIVLAGMYADGKPFAWDFLKGLYKVPGLKEDFDVAALHPYAGYMQRFYSQIVQFRGAMTSHGDGETPLWLSEFGWGSDPRDGLGFNKGLRGQAEMLSRSFRLVLNHRNAWNVQRLFWYHWRDPPPGAVSCNFCGSAGLLTNDRTAKPSYYAFTRFAAETTPPQARITGEPAQGSFIQDTTPTFSFTVADPVRDAGSTFVCRVDAGAFKPCSSPYTTPPLQNGSHLFYIQAIDAPGNESQIVYRYFTVDTVPPPAPRITATVPNSPANDNAPEVKGTAATGTVVRLFKTPGCAGNAAALGTAAKFASPGITATVANNATTVFRAKATDRAGNASPCSGPFAYVEDSTP